MATPASADLEPVLSTPRIGALDAWRGLIIVVMALDHANGFISGRKLGPELWAGPYPNYMGDWPAFLTRFVTHLAAPGFFFLLGVGAVLFAHARSAGGWSGRRITGHLALRGVLLMTLQFVWENPAWTLGSPARDWTYIGVLFALGGSLVLVSLLLHLDPRILFMAGIVLLAGAELILPARGWAPYSVTQLMTLWPGFGDGWFSLYPIFPWASISLIGMSYGMWILRDRQAAIARSGFIGLLALAGFLVVRLIDGFGAVRASQTEGALGFLNVVKYPPSIVFVLLALGVGMMALWLFSRPRWSILAPVGTLLTVFGRAPLFFYLLHLYLYGQIGLWFGGASLTAAYGWWLLGLLVLYPACRWFTTFKRRRPVASIWRFL